MKILSWKNNQSNIIIRKWLPISIIIGILSGILMSFFLFFVQALTDLVINYFWVPLAVLIAGLLTALMSKYGFKEVEGPGIAYLIELKNKKESIPPRSIFTRFFSSGISLGSNMPGGREGPAFLIGGTLAYTLGKRLKLNKDDLALCVTIGSASATSAIFSAPLGGTLFAAEVPYKRDIDMDIYLPAFIASIVSVITFFLFGRQFLGVQGLNIQLSSTIPLISLYWIGLSFVFGCVLGVSSHIYIKIYLLFKSEFKKIGEMWKQIVVATILGSLFIFISGALYPNRTEFLETGFNLLNKLSTDIKSHGTDYSFLIVLLLFKALIILFLISGGNSIGIFSPSLVLGGILGLTFSIFTGLTAFSDIFFLLGMVGALAGTAKTPISSMILILEMTGLPQMIIYMAIVSSVSYILSGETGLYESQLVDRREALKQMIESKSYLSIVPISSIMSSSPIVALNPEQTLFEAKKTFKSSKSHTIPVVDSQTNVLVGILSYSDIETKKDELIVKQVMIKNVKYLLANYSLQHALQEVLETGIEHYPVVEDETKKIIGFVTLHDILKSYFEQERIL